MGELAVWLRLSIPHPVAIFRDLIEASAGAHAKRRLFEEIAFFLGPCLFIPFLEEEPLSFVSFRSAIGSDKHPSAAELLAVKAELETALAVAFVGIANRCPAAAIPEHDC